MRAMTATRAPWRAQARATLVQTLALGLLASLLLALLLRQLAQGDAVRRKLEVSQERYALAVAGSDDGVWDWDYRSGLAFDSARSRELLALPPGVEVQPIAEQVAALNLHPDDVERREQALRAHLADATGQPASRGAAVSGLGDGLVEAGDGGLEPALLAMEPGQVVQGVGVARVEAEHAAEALLGAGRTAHGGQHQGAQVQRIARVGLQGQGLLDLVQRDVVLAARKVAGGQLDARGGALLGL